MARFYKSVVQFKQELEKDLAAIPKHIDALTFTAVSRLMDEARELMSGPISLQELRRMGHPYARRIIRARGTPGRRVPLLPVNVQSGRLRGSLRAQLLKQGRGLREVELSVSTRYSDYVVLGTVKMVARPLRREMEKRARAVAKVFENLRGRVV